MTTDCDEVLLYLVSEHIHARFRCNCLFRQFFVARILFLHLFRANPHHFIWQFVKCSQQRHTMFSYFGKLISVFSKFDQRVLLFGHHAIEQNIYGSEYSLSSRAVYEKKTVFNLLFVPKNVVYLSLGFGNVVSKCS